MVTDGTPDRKNLRLTIELVPSTCWYNNLRKVLQAHLWDLLRKSVYAKHDYTCAICGGFGRLSCHEVWEYDDISHVQLLKGFVALCDLCHHVKHVGYAEILASSGKLHMENVVKHFCSVNGVSRSIFHAARASAFSLWEERSDHLWTTDFGDYKGLIEPENN